MYTAFIYIFVRDASIAIFLADIRFVEVWPAETDFADSRFLSKNYNWQHIQTKIYANFNKNIFTWYNKLLSITIPPIWTELQIFSHSK